MFVGLAFPLSLIRPNLKGDFIPKKPSRKTLIKKLDKVFSLYIRERDKCCVICGSVNQPNNGHLFSRRHYATRWDEDNCHQQCYPCNFKHNNDPYPYNSWFIEKYGKDKWDSLYIMFRSPKKWYNFEIEELIEVYEKKYKELKDDNESKIC
tara:strand:- start:1055 stop:1507 length:453 start_codon:yes stop_codon:yes gene_type:complete